MQESNSDAPPWARGVDLPPWLTLREGARPFVVVAPHGGRRTREIRRGDSVNDLHTAGIALELAKRLDARAIVNGALDRNDIDLNRISHLATRAPELLALLEGAIDAATRDGEVPFVLFLHGWNMVVPCCDIGIGLKRSAGVTAGRHPTLQRARLDGAVVAIERELAARGLTSAIGRRYTASGRDNAAQLFSGRHHAHPHPAVARLAQLSNDGRVDAAQLELGIPLRWPGARREALIDALVAALLSEPALVHREANEAMSPRGWSLPAVTAPTASEPERGYSLQAVLDDDGRHALFCGVEATGPHTMAARFCIVSADGTMLLLVGEGSWNGEHGRYALETFRCAAGERGIELAIDGPMVRYPTHEAYLDLETGLAGSAIVEAGVRLVYERAATGNGGASYGRLRGRIEAGDLRLDVDAAAFEDRGGRRSDGPHERVRVLAASVHGGAPVVTGDLTIDGDRLVAASGAGNELREAQVLARVPVWRPVGDGVFARWTFGIVQCRFHGDTAPRPGLFDRLEIFRVSAVTPPDDE
jgi:hypothetical protein